MGWIYQIRLQLVTILVKVSNSYLESFRRFVSLVVEIVIWNTNSVWLDPFE